MKKVAVSQRVDHYPKRKEIRDSLDQRLIEFLLAAGYLPIPIPNTLVSQNFKNGVFVWAKAMNIHGVVLSGGNDIGTCICRDNTERYLIEYACLNKMPLLGICRGMQMMAMLDGARLETVQGHVGTRHHLRGEIQRNVNSYHHLTLTSIPDNYLVLSTSEDDRIEAIRHKAYRWEGWMWHPERETVFDEQDLDRIKVILG